ncbi:VWA domain-containing protein [bacterium]|nr:VWA domain-containing protein [bacterium]
MGLQPPPKPKGVSDVVFCIDVTGSMTPTIEGVKSNVRKFVDGLNSQANISLDWRVRLLAFRDLKVDSTPIEEFPFVATAEEFATQVNSVSADGGGDEPESALDAIYIAASKSDWREVVNKVIVLITDASTHPELHPSSVGAGYPTDLNFVIDYFTGEKIYLFIVGPSAPEYEALAKIPRSSYIQVGAGGTGTGLADTDFAKLLEVIGKTVSSSTSVTPASS